MMQHSDRYATAEGPQSVECKDSLRADGKHGWQFDGDDPYIFCVYRGELRDAISGMVIG